MKMRT